MSGHSDRQLYTELLHDARLQQLDWEPAIGRMSLYFHCLRRCPDGSPVSDPVVEFKITGVSAIIAGYESGLLPGPRPSAYNLRRRITIEHFQDWPFQGQEAYFTVNSAAAVDEAKHSSISDWLLGTPDELVACALRIGLSFEHTAMLGLPTNSITLVISCDGLETLSSGVPLDLDTWSEQFTAWWQGWQEHWNRKNDNNTDPCEEDTFIPAAESPPPDRTYRPPQEPAVDWQATNARKELLQPLSDWFEGRMQGDWLRVAYAQPHLDYSSAEWAAKLEERTQFDFGRWDYARQIDEWWIEGMYAEVAVRGVEHTMPNEDSPGSNVETVWNFKLRMREGRWIIRTYCQEWPPYGSAPMKPLSEKAWLSGWRSGSVKSQREQ